MAASTAVAQEVAGLNAGGTSIWNPINPNFNPQMSPDGPKWAQMSCFGYKSTKTTFFGQQPNFGPKSTKTRLFSLKIDETRIFGQNRRNPVFFWSEPIFFSIKINQNKCFARNRPKPVFLGQKPVFFQSKPTKTTFFGQNRPKPVCLVKLHRNHPKTSPFQLGPNTQSW